MLIPSHLPNPVQRRVVALCILCLVALPFQSAIAETKSDSERLEKLERAVELLQKRNAELEQEVRSLKKEKSPATASAPTPLATEKRSHFIPDSKSYVDRKSTRLNSSH